MTPDTCPEMNGTAARCLRDGSGYLSPPAKDNKDNGNIHAFEHAGN